LVRRADVASIGSATGRDAVASADPVVPLDAGTVDPCTVDTGTVEAGGVEAGTVDAGTVDVGIVDVGIVDVAELAGGVVDAGTVDVTGCVCCVATSPDGLVPCASGSEITTVTGDGAPIAALVCCCPDEPLPAPPIVIPPGTMCVRTSPLDDESPDAEPAPEPLDAVPPVDVPPVVDVAGGNGAVSRVTTGGTVATGGVGEAHGRSGYGISFGMNSL
jgi:hypothetical protein